MPPLCPQSIYFFRLDIYLDLIFFPSAEGEGGIFLSFNFYYIKIYNRFLTLLHFFKLLLYIYCYEKYHRCAPNQSTTQIDLRNFIYYIVKGVHDF